MRMTFGEEDEDAYFRRRDELGEQFAQWVNTHRVAGDPNDAGLLMDWKWSYADGGLDRWTVPDVHEFLFEWCPRKLSAAPADCVEIPLSVAAFVEFLADTGMLAPGSAAPPTVRQHCERNVGAFVREMGNPANFGMAKSLFGSVGALEPDPDPSPDGVLQMLQQLQDVPAGAVGDTLERLARDAEPPAIPPVRPPPDSDRIAAVRATPVMGQLRALAAYCASPGRKLTAKGNLQVADARHLVDALETGDDPTMGSVRKLQSSDQLPELSRLVALALEAGVVRRHRGRLVAVARFAELDECAAHEKVVLAAVAGGLIGPANSFALPVLAELHAVVDAWAIALLAELLRHSSSGVEVDLVGTMMGEFLHSVMPGLPDFMTALLVGRAGDHVDALVDLGVLTFSGGSQQQGGHVTLTAAGVPITIELLRRAGVEVPIRPEPADADVAAIVELFDHLDEEELRRDVADWLVAQPDRHAAAAALAAECLAEHRATVTAMAGITMLDELAAEHAVEVIRAHLGGPHDGLVVQWLIDMDVLDPASVDPARFMSGLIDVLAAGLDAGGPEEVVAYFSDGVADGGVEILDQIWRLDHPRLPDVLGAIGGQHQVKAVAKAARKALMRHQSRVSSGSTAAQR
ncbi:hypothetical protein GCM10009609_19720 [Pseudonocardia aurantiaca]|uniref:Uncharacterized protein n=1 Tax=Pseudonocardia aurantiaca TaxID=75290 RepID=A0ABW4FMV6_9PSEU